MNWIGEEWWLVRGVRCSRFSVFLTVNDTLKRDNVWVLLVEARFG